ncbi:hypothetical protein [Nonomuraea diastatica]|uniref:Uncharacterized protein n=1 Tax=Nonomuraea diastatica TaxID=1848329 RepID=A0A4R4WQ45_9ACTN|nr:hypothetical protein [Nonomuraea diastatica]TDD18705.1 hypothetical protein E1294_23400 [Nonomuraea diastatica]
MHVGRPSLRALRATVFAVACVLVSAAVHVLAGGAAVRPGALVLALVLTWAGAYAIGARQRGVGVLLGACFAAEYGMHRLFTVGAEAAPDPLTHAHGDSGVGMFLVHVAVALLSSWWLERGETALAAIAHLAATSLSMLWAGLLLLLAVSPVTPNLPGRLRAGHAPDRLRRLLLASSLRRRGPPLFVSVF